MTSKKLGHSLTENDRLLDICELQNAERERNIEKSNNRSNRKKIANKMFCHNEINKILDEKDSWPNDNNQLLTNSDRLWIMTHIQNRRRDRQSLQDYLRKNNEIFKIQYILNIKYEEIESWENHLRQEENALAKAEKHIGEDLALFDQFLDACNRNANEAAFRVEEEARKKDELINEIKRLQKTLVSYHNDHNHLTDILKQSRRYQQFLFKFAPKEWRADIVQQWESNEIENNQPSELMSIPNEQIDIEFYNDSRTITNENYSVYFTKPEQLLDIFTEMEEKSLPLVEKSQYTSELLDSIHSTIKNTISEQNHEVEQLKIKVNQLEESIKQEIEREISCQNILTYFLLFLSPSYSRTSYMYKFIYRQCKNEKNDPLIEQIKNTIEILYKNHIISDDMGISTIHMLQTIENKIKSLLNIIEHMDSSAVMEAEKFRENSIRTIERQEKIRQEKVINELRHKKTLLRTSAPPYPKV
ncbi:unnamed protein product [Rotaria socialis]|uniref:DUF4200 domain-containing protein n=1 Tax=Rotaria socialis TaxID=392032 RepID=A0A818Q5V3_9BILA|nr:unnamed protein product [Rotaria socialis]